MIRRAIGSVVFAVLVPLGGLSAQEGASAVPPVVEVTAKDFEFEAPEEIRSGWTTFRFENGGEQEHFFLLWHLPEEKTYQDYRTEVFQAFEQVWNRYSSGELNRKETMKALGEALPAWFSNGVKPSGGPALTEPGETARVTLHMEPGTYVMECYVKTPQGTWHGSRGMLREFTVTSETADGAPPEADVELTLSNYQIDVSGEFTAGESQTVAVHVEENPQGFLMHDVNLVRLDEGTTVREVAEWMDWMDLEEFRAPGPGHSLGGMEHMLAGDTGYMTVTLEPGRYAWVSEGYADEGMVKEFTVQ